MRDDSPRRLLQRYPAHFRPIGELTFVGNSGGLSGAALWRYLAPAGDLVCRAWPVSGRPHEELAAIHGWLARCRGLPFIPVPCPALDGRSLQQLEGRCWEVAHWLPGVPDLVDPPAAEHVAAALRGLANFHLQVGTTGRGPSPGLARRIDELEHVLGEPSRALEAATSSHAADPLAALGRRWLTLAHATVPRVLPALRDRARLQVPLQPCLRDARPEHFLFVEDSLSGLVDFGAMAIESVAGDLARLLGDWLPGSSPLRAAALEAYASVRPLDGSDLALIDAFEAAADVLIAGRWLTWHILEGRQFEDPLAVPHGIARGLARLERRAASGASATELR
jgi:homoserine kinase type II